MLMQIPTVINIQYKHISVGKIYEPYLLLIYFCMVYLCSIAQEHQILLHHFLMTGEDDPGEVLDADLTHDEAVGRICVI